MFTEKSNIDPQENAPIDCCYLFFSCLRMSQSMDCLGGKATEKPGSSQTPHACATRSTTYSTARPETNLKQTNPSQRHVRYAVIQLMSTSISGTLVVGAIVDVVDASLSKGCVRGDSAAVMVTPSKTGGDDLRFWRAQ